MKTLINADFTQRIVVRPDEYQWVQSPMKGVERMMLDRKGGEVARATSIVRYAPFSKFSSHIHSGGEEFFVLEGVFADEHQSYPKGSYVRNPIGSSHTPKISAEGAIIFVKLQQFDEDDTQQKVMDTHTLAWHQGLVDGLTVMPLHEFQGEHIALVKWAPHTRFTRHQHFGGEEIFVLEGTFYDEHGTYPKGTWLRSPHQSQHQPFTKDDGALIYVKTGHLLNMVEPD
ncbi:cupin domain-containing protein [Shewanella gelidii]|uniref:Cupin n=1 Tax=Shewanella gelidii TaxID=1642821 RepID=A0A917JL22_9GAMM|nr:cupin domain-containing protein [Shewanella gelidii]MCL1097363.1 cupin domain-containing protein [Shewanella gelidii]GGI74589.1 cupin [Shewanella gelidii]